MRLTEVRCKYAKLQDGYMQQFGYYPDKLRAIAGDDVIHGSAMIKPRFTAQFRAGTLMKTKDWERLGKKSLRVDSTTSFLA